MSINLGGMQSLSLLMGGIDYSQIIQQLTQAARAPGDALNQTIQTYQEKSNDWSDISSLASKLQDAVDTLYNSSTFTSNTTTVSGANPTAITATADSTATPGTYSISIPATNGLGSYAVSPSTASISAAAQGTTGISSAVFSQAITTGNVSVTINGTTYTHNVTSSDTISSILSDLLGTDSSGGTPTRGVTWSISNNEITFNNTNGSAVTFGTAGDTSNFLSTLGLTGTPVNAGASITTGPVEHVQLTQTLGNVAANFGSPVQIIDTSTGQPSTTSTKGAILINGVEVDYDTSVDTLQSAINSINASTAGVTASYDPTQDKVILTSKTSQPITVSDMTMTDNTTGTNTKGTLAQSLKLAATSASGNTWNYTVNGVSHSSSSPTVSNVIPGVTFTLQQAGDATLTVAQDTGTLTKNVQAFADAFNALYSKLQTYTKKGAVLQGDEAMAQLAFKYMNDVLQNNLPNIASQYQNDSVFEIGITNGAIGSAPGTTNSLVIDTSALTTAFQNDPNRVQSLIQAMAKNINKDLVSLTGNFNTTWMSDPNNLNLVSSLNPLAQSEENMYSNMIKDVEGQQQSIYDQATAQEQVMVQQFTALQQYQSQISMQQNALRAMMGTQIG